MSLIGSTAAREAKCNKLDTAIQKHLEQVLTWKTERNELALISSLPAEIMAKIFLFVRAEFLDARNELQWITISHVSTHWRNIAVNDAVLWSQLCFGHNRWTTEMIKRSKQAKLSIHFNFLYNRKRLRKTVPLLKQVLASDGCIRELDLLSIPLSQQALANALPTDFPHLERLHISGQLLYSATTPNRQLLVVPGYILSGSGKLRSLTISDCRINWISHLPSSITNLHISDSRTISHSTILQFIDTLENMPALEVLELKNSLPSHVHQECSSRHVWLRKLRRLCIDSFLAQAAMFFHHITFPPTAQVFIIIHKNRSELEMTSDIAGYRPSLLSSIAQSYSDYLSDFTFRSLTLDTDGPDWNSGIVITLYMPDAQNITYSSGMLSLTLGTFFTNSVVPTRVLQEMFDSELYLEDISFVSLGHSFPPQTLAQTLGMLPSISHIRASGNALAANNLIEALQLPAANSSEALCFANLSTLEFCNILFLDTHKALRFSSLTKLQDCLIWRYECGVEITKLCLEECFTVCVRNSVKLLKEIVVDVHWDRWTE